MKTTQNTVLITGGGSGIGFEIARLFIQQGNQVIIVGRNEERLQRAAAQLGQVTAIPCDITNEGDVNRLVNKLQADFPTLNMVINNAGKAYVYDLSTKANAFDKAGAEMLTNYLAVLHLTEQLLPLLTTQPEAALVNVSSVVAIVPAVVAPTYAASKAALHSYTQSLRHVLAQTTNIRVFELMPPLVDTEFSQEIGGSNGISPTVVADELLAAIQQDQYEIQVGQTAYMYKLSLSSPADAFTAMNGALVAH